MREQISARSPHSDRKRIYLLLIVLMITIMLTSFGRGLDINQRSLVHAMGIDEEKGGFKVTLQIFKPSGAGSATTVDPGSSNVRLISCKGATVAEALEDARSQTGQELFFGHLQVICLGRDTDLSSPHELLAFALADKSVSPATPVCMGESSAEEIISAQPDFEETSAEALSKILETGGEYCDTVACTLADISSCNGEDTALPLLAVREDVGGSQSKEGQKEPSKTAYLFSTAIISGGKAADILLSQDEAMCAAFVSNKGSRGTVTFPAGEKQQSAKLTRQSTLRKVRIEEGRLIFDCRITLAADLTADIRDPETSEQTALAIEDGLTKSTDNMLYKSREMADSDILGIKKLTRHTFPRLYLQYENDPMQLCRIADVNVEYNVKIE